MAFCGGCGTKLEGNERFCVNCGRDVSANATPTVATSATPVASTPVASAPVQPSPAFQPVQPAQPVQPIAMPAGYPPGAIPIMVAPPPAPARRGGKLGTFLVIALVAGGGYYYYATHKPAPPPPAAPSSATLVKQNAFDAHWQTVNGFIQISNGKWTNNSTVPVQSATLECDQYDASGTDLDQMRTTLNGPAQPGGSVTFNPFWMGAVASNLNRVTCTIVNVDQTANQSQ